MVAVKLTLDQNFEKIAFSNHNKRQNNMNKCLFSKITAITNIFCGF